MISATGSLTTLFSLLVLLSGCSGDRDSNPDSAKIRQSSKTYVDAFNRKDAKTLANLWGDDAVLIHPNTGLTLEGSAAIEDYFRNFLDQTGDAKIAVHIKNISYLKENIAIEEGTSTLTQKGQEPEIANYRAYYEKQKGEWKMMELEEPLQDPGAAAAEHLKELSWLIGSWSDEDKDYDVTTSSKWDDHQKFILQKFSIVKDQLPVMEGNQTIAWDPIREGIRSWIFDSAGGFGEGRWTKKGNDWVVETIFVLADGERASSVNIYSNIGTDTYTWQSTGREVAGEFLPDITPVKVTRKK